MTNFAHFDVEPYYVMPVDLSDTHDSNKTAFFRGNTRLADVTELALREYAATPDGDFTVLSAGASFGAEADSILAYIKHAAPHLGRISVIGIDKNEDAVSRARQASYVIPGFNEDERPAITEGLRPITDVIYWETDADDKSPHEGRWVASTHFLRQPHRVSFIHGDVADVAEQLPKANLIFCNNVLYHLDEARANELILHLARLLKPRGIIGLEIGYTGADPFSERQFNYEIWRDKLGDILRAEKVYSFLSDIDGETFVYYRPEDDDRY